MQLRRDNLLNINVLVDSSSISAQYQGVQFGACAKWFFNNTVQIVHRQRLAMYTRQILEVLPMNLLCNFVGCRFSLRRGARIGCWFPQQYFPERLNFAPSFNQN